MEPIIIKYNKGVEAPSESARSSISIDHKENSLYIFFSLDICDSTKMKDQIPNWKDIILKLYNTQEEFKDIMRVWKYVGDEIVFCTAFSGIESLVKLINTAYKKLESVESELTKIADKEGYTVSIKGTMWLAYISSDSSHTNQISDIDEFLGKQIDEGFRMTGFSSNNKLLLDPKIVFILLLLFSLDASKVSILEENSVNRKFANAFLNNIESIIVDYKNKEESLKRNISSYELRDEISKLVKNIYFIKYERLKGIWKDYPYPIYWYSTSQSKNEYPDINSNELLPVITDKINSKKFYSLDLISVFDKAGAKSDLDEILNIVSENTPSRPYLKNDTVQLYYSIACVKDGKVFIAKRCYDRKHLKGVWEFGFQKHTLTYTCDDIRKFFLTEFGLTVKPITDGTIENNLIPLHFCTTYRNTNKHNRILSAQILPKDLFVRKYIKDIGNPTVMESAYIIPLMARFMKQLSLEANFINKVLNNVSYRKRLHDLLFKIKKRYNKLLINSKDDIYSINKIHSYKRKINDIQMFFGILSKDKLEQKYKEIIYIINNYIEFCESQSLCHGYVGLSNSIFRLLKLPIQVFSRNLNHVMDCCDLNCSEEISMTEDEYEMFQRLLNM